MQSGRFQTILKSMAGLDNCTLSWKAETIRSKGCLGSGQALHIEMNIKIDLCQSQNLALSFWPDHGEGGGGGSQRVNVFCHRGKELSLHLELSFWNQKSFTEIMQPVLSCLKGKVAPFLDSVEPGWPGVRGGWWRQPEKIQVKKKETWKPGGSRVFLKQGALRQRKFINVLIW